MLVLEDVRRAFGGTVAVDGLSLRVGRGEIFGLLGPNGAGKSTTIAMTVGLLRPDAGRVEIDGAGPPSLPRVRARIGLCPQSIALYERLTARENLRFFGRAHGLGGREARDRADDLLRRVHLADHANRRVGVFSGGMKRRLNLAAALVHRPELVLLDEPTVGVDPHSRAAIFELVEAIRGDGAAVIYTTHYMEEAQRLCDRVGVIDRGRLLALGTVDELIAAHGGATVLRIERAGGDERIETHEPIAALSGIELAATGANRVLGVRVERPGLESVFLRLTGRSLRDH